MIGGNGHLDQREGAGNGVGWHQGFHLDNRDHLIQLFLHLLHHMFVTVHHNGHPGDSWILRDPHRQRIDVEAAAREQAGYFGEDAGMVFHQDRQGVFHRGILLYSEG